MKFDMHCHTMEGSSDAHVPIEEYIKTLQSQGFDGMLVTDHDSYNGYRYYHEHLRDKYSDFVVLKGIEYDTLDAGHIIVILPEGVELPVLEHKGLPVRLLIHIVHKYGGILGPAHPCGEPFLSIFSTGKFKKRERSIASRFDFIEGFNSGEDPEANEEAVAVAKKFNKPVTGGSDAHKIDCVGLAHTILNGDISSENELIDFIKAGGETSCAGEKNLGTIKEHLGRWNKLLVYGFFPYNKAGAVWHYLPRHKELKKIKNELCCYKKNHSDTQDIFYHLNDLINKEEVVRMKQYIQHGKVTTYDHCHKVALTSDKLARTLRIHRLDRKSMLRGALLHDFYLYDWHNEDDGSHKLHGFHHANKARDNADEILGATLKEQEIIESHMWPLTITMVPKSREAWLVCFADKYVSIKETIAGIRKV